MGTGASRVRLKEVLKWNKHNFTTAIARIQQLRPSETKGPHDYDGSIRITKQEYKIFHRFDTVWEHHSSHCHVIRVFCWSIHIEHKHICWYKCFVSCRVQNTSGQKVSLLPATFESLAFKDKGVSVIDTDELLALIIVHANWADLDTKASLAAAMLKCKGNYISSVRVNVLIWFWGSYIYYT